MPDTYYSPVYGLLLLQLSLIYFFNVLHKFSSTWQDGSFISLILWDDSIVSALGISLRGVLPESLLTFLTYGTLGAEALGAILLISPLRPTLCRLTAIVILIPLHVGILITMQIPVFCMAMISFLTLALPTFIFARKAQIAAAFENPCDVRATRRFIFESALVIYFAISFLSQLIRDNEPLASLLTHEPIPALQVPLETARLYQGWCMFASCSLVARPPTFETILVEGTLSDGREADILRSAFNSSVVIATSSFQERPTPVFSELWHVYVGALLQGQPTVVQDFTTWLRRGTLRGIGTTFDPSTVKVCDRLEPIMYSAERIKRDAGFEITKPVRFE